VAARLTIIGGGVMGLMTAFYAAPRAEAVTVPERSRGCLLGLLPGRSARFPLRPDRPSPGVPGAYTGAGWRGTGYKFAPWVGKVLAQLSVQRGTVYDIGRFTPARFAGGAPIRGVVAS